LVILYDDTWLVEKKQKVKMTNPGFWMVKRGTISWPGAVIFLTVTTRLQATFAPCQKKLK